MVTQEKFAEMLDALEAGQGAELNYEAYDLLFPPGEPDQDARTRAKRFATAHGCLINNRPSEQKIWFF